MEESFNVTNIGNGSHTPLFKHGHEIFGTQPFLMDHHRMDKSDIQKQHLLYSFDINANIFKWQNVSYGEDYWVHGKKLSYFAWALREGKIYLSPFYDHEIQVFDIQTKSITKKKRVKSRYVNNFNIVNELPGNAEEAILNTLDSDQYESFLYDKYRDVFYRIFLPKYKPSEKPTIEKLRILERSRPFTGIMVLDKDLNLLVEHVFEKFEIHSSDNFLVGRDGLYVSTNNINRDDFSEDYFRYKLLKLNYDKN